MRDINFNESGATISKIKRNLDTSQNCLFFSLPGTWKPSPNEWPFSPSSYSMLLRVKRELSTSVFFGPKQHWIGVGRRPFRSVLFKRDSSNAQMFGNWWNCLNSFVRGCSSRERPSILGRSWISSSDKSLSESWEVQLAGISNVVSNNEPTIMHVSATITGCRPRGHTRAWRGAASS